MVGGTRILPNLSEILSPTLQPSGGGTDRREDGGDDDVGGAGRGSGTAGGGRWNGSYHCQLYRDKRRCDVCSHMSETPTITSTYFGRKFAIHGRNVHLPASQKKKYTWFVYVVEDKAFSLTYVGSTVDVCSSWAQTKKACLDRNSINTGLYRPFRDGCPAHVPGGTLSHLVWTILWLVRRNC